MKRPEQDLEIELQRLRPILVTLAETIISPAFRGHIEASDLVQQTLMEAHVHTRILETLDDGPFFSRLRKALQNNVLDAVRHLKTQKCDVARSVRESELEESFARLEQLLVEDQTSPSQIVSRNEQLALMLAALQDLPTNQRMSIILKHLRGQSLREVAEALEVSESAAAGLLHRGRQQLLRCMEMHGHE